MAKFLELQVILSLTIALLIALQFQTVFSYEFEEDREYILDHPLPREYIFDHPLPSLISRSRFLASAIKEGAKCNPAKKNICNGILANKGTGLLYCCKTKCVNVLGDRNHCGQCGVKCKLGELCCHGKCTKVANNINNCGKCDRKCSRGVKCVYATCGYA